MMTALNGYTEELKNNQKTSQKALMQKQNGVI